MPRLQVRLDAAGELDREGKTAVAKRNLGLDDVDGRRREPGCVTDPRCERPERSESAASYQRLEAALEHRVDEVIEAEAQHEIEGAVPRCRVEVAVHGLAHPCFRVRVLAQLR